MPRKRLAQREADVFSEAGKVKECVRVTVPLSGSLSGPASVPARLVVARRRRVHDEGAVLQLDHRPAPAASAALSASRWAWSSVYGVSKVYS